MFLLFFDFHSILLFFFNLWQELCSLFHSLLQKLCELLFLLENELVLFLAIICNLVLRRWF
jgi:hypothetical protein